MMQFLSKRYPKWAVVHLNHFDLRKEKFCFLHSYLHDSNSMPHLLCFQRTIFRSLHFCSWVLSTRFSRTMFVLPKFSPRNLDQVLKLLLSSFRERSLSLSLSFVSLSCRVFVVLVRFVLNIETCFPWKRCNEKSILLNTDLVKDERG